MIARHSAEQSKGGEGVEVVENRPCHDDEHGDGQFTEKRIYLTRLTHTATQTKLLSRRRPHA